MALPNKDHWNLRGDELHPIGPRWTVPSVNALYALDVGADDLGHVALVQAPRSLWVVLLGSGEGETWGRLTYVPPADEGGGSSSPLPVEHVQTTPATEWEVTHGLDRYPPVVVMDEAGEAMTARVRYLDRQRVLVLFASPRTGRLSIGG